MQPKRKLLESAASEILDQIRLRVADAVTIEVMIRKSNPPFGGDLSCSQVSLKYFKD
jgi:dihydroneopterin aldolase